MAVKNAKKLTSKKKAIGSRKAIKPLARKKVLAVKAKKPAAKKLTKKLPLKRFTLKKTKNSKARKIVIAIALACFALALIFVPAINNMMASNGGNNVLGASAPGVPSQFKGYAKSYRSVVWFDFRTGSSYSGADGFYLYRHVASSNVLIEKIRIEKSKITKKYVSFSLNNAYEASFAIYDSFPSNTKFNFQLSAYKNTSSGEVVSAKSNSITLTTGTKQPAPSITDIYYFSSGSLVYFKDNDYAFVIVNCINCNNGSAKSYTIESYDARWSTNYQFDKIKFAKLPFVVPVGGQLTVQGYDRYSDEAYANGYFTVYSDVSPVYTFNTSPAISKPVIDNSMLGRFSSAKWDDVGGGFYHVKATLSGAGYSQYNVRCFINNAQTLFNQDINFEISGNIRTSNFAYTIDPGRVCYIEGASSSGVVQAKRAIEPY